MIRRFTLIRYHLTIRNIYIASFIIYLLAVLFSVGYYHPDEHHQLLEFAGLKLGMNEGVDLPWEYRYQMRPTLQVYLVVWIYSFLKFLGLSSPFLLAAFLRLLSVAISFLGIHLLIKAFLPKIESHQLKILFVLLAFLLWFNVFNNVRFSSENWSGTLFMIGFSLLQFESWRKYKHYLLIGLLFGFSIVFRFQTGLLIGGLILWLLFINKKSIKIIALLILGIFCSIGIGVISDFFYYNEWTFTYWNYLYQNLVLGKASGFGIEPWWFYLTESFLVGIPPLSLIFIFSFLLVFIFKPKSILTWTFLPFIIIHSIIGHKELRFLFPILGFLPLFIIESFEIVQKWMKDRDIFKTKLYRITKISFFVVYIIVLIVITFKPAESNVNLYKAIYNGYSQPAYFISIGENPYLGSTELKFYQRENLEVLQVSEFKDIYQYQNGVKLFVTADKDLIAELDQDQKLVYTALPEWVKKFNFNNWVERTKFWRVYEITTNENSD